MEVHMEGTAPLNNFLLMLTLAAPDAVRKPHSRKISLRGQHGAKELENISILETTQVGSGTVRGNR